MKQNNTYTKLAIFIVIIGILLRFYLASTYHISGDACWQISNSRFIAENNELPLFEHYGRDEPFWPPPVFHILSATIYKISPNPESNVKLLSPLLGSLTLIIFFLLANKLFNAKTAFYSTLFLTFIPLHLDYSVFSYIDSTVTFFTLLSVYLALNNRIYLASIAAGLSVLSKYNGIFILPVLFIIIYKKKNFIKNFLTISFISGLLSSFWFIRNWIYLRNPIWPFVNNIFNGYQAASFTASKVGSITLSKILHIKSMSAIYLGVYGVPNGNLSSFSIINIPFLNILITIWLLATLIFSLPILIGLFSKQLKNRNLISIWIISYIILAIIYIINAGWAISRFLLPAFPAIALLWGHGLTKIKHFKKSITLLLILIIIGLSFTSFVKIKYAADEWKSFNNDFDWVKSNTPKDSIFLSESQCLSYNINRQSLSPLSDNIKKVDYVFTNQDFKIDNRITLDDDVLNNIKFNSILVYKNQKTNTKIYKISEYS